MPPPNVAPNYRQQRAIEAIDRAAAELGIAIQAHTPDADAACRAQRTLETLTASVKAVILNDER